MSHKSQRSFDFNSTSSGHLACKAPQIRVWLAILSSAAVVPMIEGIKHLCHTAKHVLCAGHFINT